MAFKAGAGPNGEDLVETRSGKFFLPKTPEVFSYDLDGNLLADGRWLYTWDSENRLIAVEGSANVGAGGNVGATSASRLRLLFTYDPQSRRLQRRQYAWDESASDWTLTEDTRYLYDGWNCVAEFDGSGTLQAQYVWGLDLSGSEQGAGGVSGLLFGIWSSPSFQGPVSSFYCYDGNGNVVALASTVDGALQARYDYAPFGETVSAEDVANSNRGTEAAPTLGLAALNPYRFSTKPQDPACHLYYYGYRWYSVYWGKWMSRDIIGENGGRNIYVIVGNKTLQQNDILGLACCIPGHVKIRSRDFAVIMSLMTPDEKDVLYRTIENAQQAETLANILQSLMAAPSRGAAEAMLEAMADQMRGLPMDMTKDTILSAYVRLMEITMGDFNGWRLWARIQYSVCVRVSVFGILSYTKWDDKQQDWKAFMPTDGTGHGGQIFDEYLYDTYTDGVRDSASAIDSRIAELTAVYGANAIE